MMDFIASLDLLAAMLTVLYLCKLFFRASLEGESGYVRLDPRSGRFDKRSLLNQSISKRTA